jgi:hypothetical protein
MICGFGGSKNRFVKAAGTELFGQMRDEKLYVVVARNTFRNQNMINKQNTRSGVLLAVTMSKKCMPLWRDAYFEVNIC